tara:strand:- start:534 stop:875 length:342 start_codon:yes stop_codon:yes gene_type:complete
MINSINKFIENNLNIKFSGESINDNEINILVSNDVNFKEVIDYLINIISNKDEINFSFENFDNDENTDKLQLIKETIEEIYEKFNLSIQSQNLVTEGEIITIEEDSESDDLPF